MNWCIYYDDGSTFGIQDGSPLDAPKFGVIVIAQWDAAEKQRNLMQSWDFYYWHAESGLWWGIDEFGIIDRLMHALPIEALKQGRTIGTGQYREIMTRADKEFKQ